MTNCVVKRFMTVSHTAPVTIINMIHAPRIAVYETTMAGPWMSVPADAMQADTFEEARMYVLLFGHDDAAVLFKEHAGETVLALTLDAYLQRCEGKWLTS